MESTFMIKPARKIYVVGGADNYANWCEGEIVHRMEDADLVVFTGGEDVTPGIYGRKPHPTTSSNWRRDEREIKEFEQARALNKHLIGICRGSQFLCVMAGGILVQNQRHPPTHDITLFNGERIKVTSTHHQRQHPWGLVHDFECLGWCNLSPYSYGETNKQNLAGYDEVEIAHYPSIKALAIQSHPEYCYPETEVWHYPYIKACRALLDRHMAT